MGRSGRPSEYGSPIALPELAIVCAGLGLLVVAVSNNLAQDGRAAGRPLFWVGYLLITVPVTAAVALRDSGRWSHVRLLVTLAGALYLVKVLHDPTAFTFHDEFGHWATADAISRSHDVFSHNPLLTVSPFYPALELITTALASTAGLSIATAGMIVLGVAKICLLVGLYLAYSEVISPQLAAVAACFYAANPNFAYFDSQYSYESFAIPLAVIAALAVARYRRRAMPVIVPTVFVAAVVVAHHLTSYALAGFFGIMSLATRLGSPAARRGWRLAAAFAAGTVALAAAWAATVAPTVRGYLTPVLHGAVSSVVSVITGSHAARRPFHAPAADLAPKWERIATIGSVFLVIACILAGLGILWRMRRSRDANWALAAVALLYPLLLAFRLGRGGAELANRSTEFSYFGVAYLLALCATQTLGWAARARGALRWPGGIGASLAAAALVFLGGFELGWAPVALQPGPYLPGANSRSITEQGTSAAVWAGRFLPSGSRVFTDKATALQMGSYGRLAPQIGYVRGAPLARLMTSGRFDPSDRHIVKKDALQYIVVDLRLSTAVPADGFYFYPTEPHAYEYGRPVPRSSLTKFATVRSLDKVFTNGSVSIYGTRRVSAP